MDRSAVGAIEMPSKSSLRRRDRKRDDEREQQGTPKGDRGGSDPVRSLHRSVGNQAVKSMIESGQIAPGGRSGARRSAVSAPTGSAPTATTAGPVVQRQSSAESSGREQSSKDRGDERRGQQEPWATKSERKKYEAAAGKALKGLRKTEPGKTVEEMGTQALMDWWSADLGPYTLPPLGAGALVLMDGPLPFSAPAIPVHSVFGMNEGNGEDETKEKLYFRLNLVGLPKGEAPYAADEIRTGVTYEREPITVGTDVEIGTGTAGKEGHTHYGPGAGDLEWKVMLKFETEF